MKKLILIKIIFLFLSSTLYSQAPPVLLPNFPIVLDSMDYTYNNGPIVADFNNDGQNDILVGVNLDSPIGKVILVDNNGISFKNFPKSVSCSVSYIWVAAGDVDGNGTIDIVVKSDSLYVFDFVGNRLPGFPLYVPIPPNNPSDKIAIYDFDNDKTLEIVLARKNVITIVNHNGTIRNGWPKTISQGNGNTIVSSFSIGDLNNDNIAEIIIPASNVSPPPHIDTNKIYIFEPDGTAYLVSPINSDSGYSFDYWSYPVIYENKNQAFFSVLSNYSPDLLPNNFRSRFTIYNQLGKTILQTGFVPFYRAESLTMGKLNVSEYFFLGGDFYFTHGFKSDGTSLPGYPLFISSDQLRNHNIGKLSNKVCFISTDTRDTNGGNGSRGYIKAWDITGIQLSWSPLRPLGIPGTAPSFADLNNDGQAELIATSNFVLDNDSGCALYVWTLPGVKYTGENFPWPMWGHDRYRTNQYGFIPPDEPVGIQPISNVVPDEFELHQNYPNPFNPTTTIRFDVSVSGNVSLKVYDVLGREVAVLANEYLRAGSYERVFEASNLSTGVYFYTLRADEFEKTLRMVVLK